MLNGKGTHASDIVFVSTWPGSNQRSTALEASTFRSYLPVVTQLIVTGKSFMENVPSLTSIGLGLLLNDAC
jgi:hypothetical protein